MAKVLVIDEVLAHQAAQLSHGPGGGGGSAAAPTTAAGTPGGSRSNKGRLLKFTLPCHNAEQRLFLFQDSILYELQQPTMGDKTSWFLDDSVIEDGSFLLATPFQVRVTPRCCPHCQRRGCVSTCDSYPIHN